MSKMADNMDTQPKEVWSSPADQSQQLMKHIQEIETRLDKIEEHIGLTADKVKREELEKSRQEVAALRERLESALNHIQEKEKQLQDTQDRLTNHANRIQELEGEKRKLSNLVQILQTELTTSEQKVMALEHELNIVKKGLQDTECRLDKTEQELTKSKSKQDQTDKELEKTKYKQAQTQEELEETKYKQAQTQEELEQTNKGLKALEAKVAKLVAEGGSRAQAATPTDVRVSVAVTPRERSKPAGLKGLTRLPPIVKNTNNDSKYMNFPPQK